jgi:hypothetical protein
MPWRLPVSSISPTARSTAAGGSSSRPSESARKKNSSESVEPLDLGIQRRVDGQGEVALDLVELTDQAVVHPQPPAVAKRMAVRLLDGRAAGGADVREHERRAHVRGELTQVLVVPGGLDAPEDAGLLALAVPAETEPVAVRRLRAELRMEALVDQRMAPLVQQVLDQDRGSGIGEPTAHVALLSFVR